METKLYIPVIFLIIVCLGCEAGPKPYTYYRITEVEESAGLSLSKDLIKSICLKKLIHFGHFEASLSPSDMFSVGKGSRSGQDAHFFEMYPAGEMLITYQKTNIRYKTLDLQYDGKNFPLFSYRGTSDYFSAPSSDIIVSTVISGRSGAVTIKVGSKISIKLKVKESNDWNLSKDKELDLKDLIGEYYPFDVTFKSISGSILFTNRFLQSQGKNSLINEPVIVIIAQLRTGELYCLGFRCSDGCLQDAWGHTTSAITPLRREAGFASPIPISPSQQTLVCTPKDDGTIICGGGTDQIKLTFNAGKSYLKTYAPVFYPYGIHWSSQIFLNN